MPRLRRSIRWFTSFPDLAAGPPHRRLAELMIPLPVTKGTITRDRKGPSKGRAGQPRAQALGAMAGPDVHPERVVQTASAFQGWYPGHPCPQGLRPLLSCSTLSGSERGRFMRWEEACCFPRACALGSPARPFQSRLHPLCGRHSRLSAKQVTMRKNRRLLFTVAPSALWNVPAQGLGW